MPKGTPRSVRRVTPSVAVDTAPVVSGSANRRSATRQASVSVPKRSERQLEVVHHGLGHLRMGERIDQSILGDRENIRRLLDLGAVKWHIPEQVDPLPEEDDEPEDDGDFDIDDDDEADEEDEEDEDNESESTSNLPSLNNAPSPSPLLGKIITTSAQSGGDANASVSPKAQDLGKK